MAFTDYFFSDDLEDDGILAVGDSQQVWAEPQKLDSDDSQDDNLDEDICAFQKAIAECYSSPASLPMSEPMSDSSEDDMPTSTASSMPTYSRSQDSQIDQSQSQMYAPEDSEHSVFNKLSDLLTKLRQKLATMEDVERADGPFRDTAGDSSQGDSLPADLLKVLNGVTSSKKFKVTRKTIITLKKFLASTRVSCKTLSRLIKIIQISQEAILTKTPVTKRDVFYRDPSLFDNQGVSDKLIDLLSELLGEKRGALNIRASPRGMFAGSAITLLLKSGEEITASATRGQTIPVEEDIERIDVRDDISFVVVVEKEAVFQTLLAKSFADHTFSDGKGLIITGKGYPDLATRDLFKRLAQDLPPWVPITVLVDADPYGLDILNQFVKACDGQAGERVQWIGVFGTEWTELGIEPQQLLPLKPTDCRKAFKMLRETPDLPSRWREELQHMLFLQRKAEIECLSSLHCMPSSPFSSYPGSSFSSSTSSTPSLSTYFLPSFDESSSQLGGTDSPFSLFSEPLTNYGEALVQYLIRKLRPKLGGAEMYVAVLAQLDEDHALATALDSVNEDVKRFSPEALPPLPDIPSFLSGIPANTEPSNSEDRGAAMTSVGVDEKVKMLLSTELPVLPDVSGSLFVTPGRAETSFDEEHALAIALAQIDQDIEIISADQFPGFVLPKPSVISAVIPAKRKLPLDKGDMARKRAALEEADILGQFVKRTYIAMEEQDAPTSDDSEYFSESSFQADLARLRDFAMDEEDNAVLVENDEDAFAGIWADLAEEDDIIELACF